MKIKFKLGSRVRDKITGFEGVAYGYTVWLNGCVRFCVRPTELKDGKPIEDQWFDDGDLEVVKETKKAKKKNTGGPRPVETG